MDPQKILNLLPFAPPFLFVEELQEITEDGVRGSHTFDPDSFFYKGHFKDYPLTPGVILTECMGQIGVVCLGIFLLRDKDFNDCAVSLSSTSIQFFLPVFPGEKVEVISEKIYFRFNKLKCAVKMLNGEGKLVCRGEISGMIGKR